MTCRAPCYKPMYPDTETVLQSYGMRVRLVCAGGHSTWLTLGERIPWEERPIKRVKTRPIGERPPCEGCGAPGDPLLPKRRYCVACHGRGVHRRGRHSAPLTAATR